MKWLKWPFQFSVHFSVGGSTNWEPESLAAQALRMAADRNPADTASPNAAVEAAETYLAYLEKHK